ncbi:hypothetical protein POTOM_052958 [Populus tomentosa]|uniref:Mitochondrial import inner membrane translocase subunit TIM50 n=1 Tax=Populus tomentosa TaxID=118781 RepID=A0A8X8C6D1_POPTO|nr:hypothetical protein POTOM_052958 [Populus tomentosa]
MPFLGNAVQGFVAVVLDLDETLVCAYETSSLPPIIRTRAVEAGDVEGKPEINHVTVFERPGLKEFLKQIGEFADLILFTAGIEGFIHATPELGMRILSDSRARSEMPLERNFTCHCLPLARLWESDVILLDSDAYRLKTSLANADDLSHCVNHREYRELVKDLSCLSKDLSRVVIVDNNPFSFLLQPLNGIPCVPFSAGLPYDDQDVRPVLHKRFHMPEWFQMHGIPASALTVRENVCTITLFLGEAPEQTHLHGIVGSGLV